MEKKESVATTGQYQLKMDLTIIILTILAQGNVKPHHQLRIDKITAKVEQNIQT